MLAMISHQRAMAKLILHIGMVKTGSTAIQSSLAAADGKGFIYPQLGEPPFKNHHTDALLRLFSGRYALISEQYRLAGKTLRTSDSDEDRIRQAAIAAGKGIVILSSEGAAGRFTKEGVAALARFTEQVFDHVTVVAYVREPYALISSNLWTRMIGSRLARFDPRYGEYRIFKKWDKVFGGKNVKLWKYDRKTFPKGDVVRHFCKRLGLEPLNSNESNVTVSRPAVSAIYRLNRALSDQQDEMLALKTARNAIIRHFPHRDWPKFRLSPEVVAPLIEDNLDDLNWIEGRMNCSLREPQEPRESDVRDEADLLRIDPAALTLLKAIGATQPANVRSLLDRALSD